MSASVSLTNSWSNGNQFVRDYSLIIYNDSGDNISGWSCVLNKDADVSIIGLWGASFIDQESIVLINGSNSIANGESIKINFQAASVSSDFSISVSSVNKS